jgi:glycerophosphoryl diester phosphodiesterase
MKRLLHLSFALLVALAGTAQAIDLQGHRGARGVYPENTLPAFAHALSVGVTTLELDTGLTADGVVVVSHNRRLDPNITRDASGVWLESPTPSIASMTLEQLKKLDVGAIRPGTDYARIFGQQRAVNGTPMPTLAEVFALARKSGNAAVRFNIETKISPVAEQDTADPETMTRALVETIRKEGMAGRATIQSFDWRTLQIAQRLAPEIPTAYLSVEQGNPTVFRDRPSPWLAGFDPGRYGGSLPRAVKEAGGRIWSPYFRDTTPASVAEAKSLGLQVIVWTVNQPPDMAAMLDRGVDGIITDYPERLREVMSARGLPLPAPTPVTP